MCKSRLSYVLDAKPTRLQVIYMLRTRAYISELVYTVAGPCDKTSSCGLLELALAPLTVHIKQWLQAED